MLLSVPEAVHCLKHRLPLTSTELAPFAAVSLADWVWRLTLCLQHDTTPLGDQPAPLIANLLFQILSTLAGQEFIL